MNPIVIDDAHKKCPYCYAAFERKNTEGDALWARRTYCSTACAAKGGHLTTKMRKTAKKRVICGDS